MAIRKKIAGLGSVVAIGFLVGALTGCGSGSNNSSGSTTTAASAPTTGQPPSATAAGANWLTAVHGDDVAEIRAGRLAETAGSTESVRNTGRMLAVDHALIDSGIRMLARKYNVTLPAQLPAAASTELDKLQGLHGPAFDQAFVPFFISGHRSAVSATQEEIAAANQPTDIVDYAKAVLPVIQRHLDMLQMENAGH